MTGGGPQWTCNCQGTACFCRPAVDNTCAAPFNAAACAAPWPTYQWSVSSTWPPSAPRLSDDDVERIATRVVELMVGGK